LSSLAAALAFFFLPKSLLKRMRRTRRRSDNDRDWRHQQGLYIKTMRTWRRFMIENDNGMEFGSCTCNEQIIIEQQHGEATRKCTRMIWQLESRRDENTMIENNLVSMWFIIELWSMSELYKHSQRRCTY
jgi:hypothetical protein